MWNRTIKRKRRDFDAGSQGNKSDRQRRKSEASRRGIEEGILHDAIMRALNQVISDHKRRNIRLQSSMSLAFTGSGDGFDPVAIQNRIDERNSEIMDWVQRQVKEGFAVKELEARVAGISAEIEELRNRIRLHEIEKSCSVYDDSRLNEMLAGLQSETLNLDQYDNALIRRMVEGVKVVSAEKIVVRFGWGVEIEGSLC